MRAHMCAYACEWREWIRAAQDRQQWVVTVPASRLLLKKIRKGVKYKAEKMLHMKFLFYIESDNRSFCLLQLTAALQYGSFFLGLLISILLSRGFNLEPLAYKACVRTLLAHSRLWERSINGFLHGSSGFLTIVYGPTWCTWLPTSKSHKNNK